MDRGEGVKPQEPSLNVIVERESESIVCVGGLDTNDEEEVGEYYDGGMSSGYLDDRTGLELDENLTRQAEAEEMAFMQKIQLYDVVDTNECWTQTGKPPVTTKWVRVNRGTSAEPDVRCRLVARDFKPKGERDRSEIFAAMPPLESKKLLFQQAVSQNARNRRSGEDGIKVMLIDVKKAHLNGFVGEDECAYIELPSGVARKGQCGRLRRWLYGMRQAASAWEKDYSEKLSEIGFAKGIVAPTVFYWEERGVRCVVHGDDFTFSGKRVDLLYIRGKMEESYELKMRAMLGDDFGDDKEIAILNRSISWRGESIHYEADPKHVSEILKYFDLDDDSKTFVVPFLRETKEELAKEDHELSPEVATEFRGLAARANYLSLDRVDIQFATKEICRDMASPKASSLSKMKRLARYLLGAPRQTIMFQPCLEEFPEMLVYSDSDWAGCLRTRKSTSGG